MTICKVLKLIVIALFTVLSVALIAGLYIYEESAQTEIAKGKSTNAVKSLDAVFTTLLENYRTNHSKAEATISNTALSQALMNKVLSDKKWSALFETNALWVVVDDPLDGLVFINGESSDYPQLKPSDYFVTSSNSVINNIRVNKAGVVYSIALLRGDSDVYGQNTVFAAASKLLTPYQLFSKALSLAVIPAVLILIFLVFVARTLRRLLLGCFKSFNELLDRLESDDDTVCDMGKCFVSAEQHEIALKIDSIKNRIKDVLERAEGAVEKLDGALRSVGVGVLITTVDGKIVFINNVAELMLSCKSADIVGEDFASTFRLINSDSREFVASPIKTVLETQESLTFNSDIIVVGMDGVETLITLNANPIINKHAEIEEVVIIFRDINDEVLKHESIQKVNKLLKRNAEDMKLILGVAKIATWEFNLKNRALVAGRDFSDLLHIEEKERYFVFDDILPRLSNPTALLEVLNKDLLKQDGTFSIKEAFKGDDGICRWIICSGKAYNINSEGDVEDIRGVIVDVTENEVIQEELETQSKIISISNKRLQQVYDLARVFFWEYDVDAGVVTGDKNFSKIFLDGAPDFVSGNIEIIYDKINPDCYEEMESIVREAMTNKEKGCILEFSLKPDSRKRVRFFRSYYNFEYDNDFKVSRSYGIVIDVTEEHERQVRQIQASKMESIGLLSGGIAHDFNNMLNGMFGMIELLEMRIDNSDVKANLYCKNLKNACDNASELTKHLLRFSRKNKDEYELINLREIIDSTLIIMQHSMGSKVDVNVCNLIEGSYINGDFSEIQNSILNLVINAMDAMVDTHDARIIIGVDKFDDKNCEATQYCGNLIQGKSYIKLEISDNGKGIDPSDIAKVFEPFYTTKSEGKGTGLGLSTIADTIVSHEGAVYVDSEVGVGTTFCLVLPLVCPTSPSQLIGSPVEINQKSEPEPRKVYRENNKHGSVLIVDDEPMMRIIYRQMLLEHGYTVIEAENGEIGVAKYSEHFNTISGVIMDLQMPVMDGKAAFEKMKLIDKNAKVIFVSGYLGGTKKQELLDMGALTVLGKPFRKKSFLQNIRTMF